MKSIKKFYKNNWNLLKQSKKFILFALLIFVLMMLIGFFLPIFFNETILKMIEKLMLQFKGKNMLETIGIIFINNLRTSFIAMILGLFFGIVPLIIAVTNGYILGFVSNIAVKEQGISSLWRLLPHGIFELPAVLLAIGLGIHLGFLVIHNKKQIKEEIVKSLIFFLAIIFPLLIIAAVIEGILIFAVG